MSRLTATQNVAVDVVLIANINNRVKIFLQKDDDSYYLPGVLLKHKETVSSAIQRTIESKINPDSKSISSIVVKNSVYKQLLPMTNIDRDPRGHVISLPVIVFATIESTDRSDEFIDINKLSNLRFKYDHIDILNEVIHHLKQSLTGKPYLLLLMNDGFTLTDIKNLYGSVDCKFNQTTTSNFKKISNVTEYLEEIDVTSKKRHVSGPRPKRFKVLKGEDFSQCRYM